MRNTKHIPTRRVQLTRPNRRTLLATLASMFAMSAVGSVAVGHEHRCSRCGTQCACRKVCRLVREERTITVTCWGIQDEEFCVNGPSCLRCEKCENVCSCSKDEKGAPVRSGSKPFVWKIWDPTSAKIFTKKKLMKKTETKKVPSFKWVIEDLCPECRTASLEEKKESKADNKNNADLDKSKSP
jgi:hypothetical protein